MGKTMKAMKASSSTKRKEKQEGVKEKKKVSQKKKGSSLFKDKGHNKRDDPTKYRPVSVTTIEYRILGKCIAQMLNKAVQFLIADPQVGFYPGRTYDENVALVRGTLRDLNGRRAQDGGLMLFLDNDSPQCECPRREPSEQTLWGHACRNRHSPGRSSGSPKK